MRLINPNFSGYLTFSTNSYSGNVSSGFINFTVLRTVGSRGTLSLQYRTVDLPGSPNTFARNSIDYVGSTNTLTWNNGDVSPRTVSVPLLNNNTVGGTKFFGVTLFNATNNGLASSAVLGTITNVTCVINNDNSYGTFQFSSPSYQVNENGGFATINVTRTGSASG